MDLSLPHLDRPFDYLVPSTVDDQVGPGSRVRVRFAGQLVDAIVLDRVASSDHTGTLSYLERPVSAEPVLSAEVGRLARAVADRWAGSLADVLRLALPPRHARTEARPAGEPAPAPAPPDPTDLADPTGWARYPAGPAFVRAVSRTNGQTVGRGQAARAVWQALPGEDWPARLAEAARAALAAGRGVVVVVPDHRDLARVDAAFSTALGAGRHVALSADLGPAERYRRWLAARRGEVWAVVGTRSAAFAPVANLGLLAIWDDGDNLYAEPRAPYPHTRDVLVLRAHLAAAALLVGGFARTAEAALLVESGWARQIEADRAEVRRAAARVSPVGDDDELARDPVAAAARLPALAFAAARQALAAGAPVLVQVPRRGYLPALACARCRAPARCGQCAGPLAASSGHAIPACRWCGRPAGGWCCPSCDGVRFRAVLVGASRTAEELGRAFPGVPLRTSAGDRVLDRVPAGPALVVATPGAEPVADGGYGAALLLDGWALLSRPDLRAAEETLRRWYAAAALVRPAAGGGRVVVGADASLAAVQALIRWDPAGHAARELAERTELGFPPAVRMAALTGSAAAVAELVAAARLPAGAELLGPVPVNSQHENAGAGHAGASPAGAGHASAGAGAERLLIRVSRAEGAALAAALHQAAAVRSARKATGTVRIQLDSVEFN